MQPSMEEQKALDILKEQITDKKVHLFEWIKMVCDADEIQRKHMGLQPGKFEEYITRHVKKVAKEIEDAIRAHERKYPH